MSDSVNEHALVWWRVSTEDQKEISPETQIKEATALAKREGYEVLPEYVLGTDWQSLSVWSSPAMEQLKELVLRRAVKAIFMYDADRGPSKPIRRLLLRALCEDHDVRISCVYGQVPDGEMGEVMEFLSAWQKEKQVLRAQQGARDGLRARATLRGLPAVPRAPYGYQWNGRVFESDPVTFPMARRIWELALDGVSIAGIARQLTETGIPSPSGKTYWNTSTIARILSNPTYGGKYVALRTKAVEPKTRRGDTYGKSGRMSTVVNDQVSLPGLVTDQVVTPEEFARVQERLAVNKAQGGNVLYDYLLRGMVRCELCGRRWRGKAHRARGTIYLRYLCPGLQNRPGGRRCVGGYAKGPHLESRVWDAVVTFLSDPEVFLGAVEGQARGNREAVERVGTSIYQLDNRLGKLQDTDAKAYSGYVRGITSEETYKRVVAELKAERTWIIEELERQKEALEEANRDLVSAEAIKELYPLLAERIQNATFEDRRFVLECLDTEATVGPSGVVLSLGVPETLVSPVSTRPRVGGWATDNHCGAKW